MSILLKQLTSNQSEIAAQVLDGELIIINLSDGVYYSMDEIGADVWVLLEQGYSLSAISQTLSVAYNIPQNTIEDDLQALGQQLISENLVRVSEQDLSTQSSLPQLETIRDSYRSPILNIYRDMADMLALDPPMPDLKEVPWK
ncbi:PqqD family protein [Synechococcus sp. PCC 6312]|uniref:PqqD family protein n=1 Tax=Synechococcus sp. (strain ATCC 27167 / PCC 6312) TaxID=195253 RepID=UPI00029F28E2|nr:PqqD family protein [Synechococcus sp. PCC 6312]AFY61435.1 Coenzyme PQQ synthesis protein D (PqqD) [Synechococcus sp. PCC 6312]